MKQGELIEQPRESEAYCDEHGRKTQDYPEIVGQASLDPIVEA